MPTTVPVAVAGERLPKRARPLATGVRDAIRALVWGDGTEGRRPATLAEAASAGKMRIDTLRRYLHRADVRSLIADERNAYLAWATGANGQVLTAIRDLSENDGGRVRAIALLEEMAGLRERPGVAVNVGLQVNNQVDVKFRPGYVIRLRAREPNENRPVVEPEPVLERPEHHAFRQHRELAAQARAEDDLAAEQERRRLNRVFDGRPVWARD